MSELLVFPEDAELKKARDPNTSSELLCQLSESDKECVRFEVASNKSTSAETLSFLAGDFSELVRSAVASNINAWEITLEWLSEDGSKKVRCNVASNPQLDFYTLVNMLLDDEIDVRESAYMHFNIANRYMWQ